MNRWRPPNRLLKKSRSCFDKPVLSAVEGLSTNGKSSKKRDQVNGFSNLLVEVSAPAAHIFTAAHTAFIIRQVPGFHFLNHLVEVLTTELFP